jgi:hypothetical protein
MTTPGNVIYFGFTNNVESDKKKIYDMLHPGDMVLVNVKHPEVFMNSGGVLKVADYYDVKDKDFAQWNSCTNDPVDELVNMDMYGFFVKASDLFYSNSDLLNSGVTTIGSNVYLRCENDWYHIDFGRRFPFILANDITVGLYNIVKNNVVIPHRIDDGAGVCPGGWGSNSVWNPDEVSDYAWEVVDNTTNPWNLWSKNETQSIVPEEPQTPPNPVRNLINHFDQASKDTTGDNVGYNVVNYDSDSSDIELTSGSESDAESDVETDVEECAQDPDDEEYSDDEYSPSESGSSDSSNSSDLSEMDDEFWDEKREDVDGEWYTRRQFYDYYGSDEAWENLDPNIYHQYRYDDQYGIWATKEEFYQHYGSYRIWKRMHPMKVMRRKALWDTYCWSMYLPKHLRDKFIKEMLETYE